MDSLETTRLLERFKKAQNVAWPWHELYSDVYRYTQPFRNPFSFSQSNPTSVTMYQSGDTQTESSGHEIYDSTAVLGCHSLSAKLLSYLVPPYQEWQKFDAGPEIPDLDKERFQRAAERATKSFFKFLNETNFYVAATEAFYDLIVGTAALYVTKGDSLQNPLNFQAVPISNLFFEEDSAGIPQTVFFERKAFNARDIQQMWPKATMSQETARALEQDINHTVDLLEMTIYEEEKKSYRYIVLEQEGKHPLVDSTSPSSPWIIFRWSKTPGDVWGTGPATHIISDVKTLNAIAEDELRSAAFKASPMWFAWSDGVFNPHQFVPQPGAVLVGSSLAGNQAPIRPIPVEGDAQFVQLLVQDLRARIEKALFMDMVRPNDAQPLTATEVLYKKQVLLEQIEPAFGRLQIEFLPRLTRRILYLLKDWGLFPDVQIDGKKVRLTYTSPLAQGQNNSDIQSFIQYMQILQQTLGPQMSIGAINVPELPTWLAEKTKVDLDIIKSSQEIQEALQEAAQAAQQQESQLPQAGEVEAQQPQQL